MPKDHERIFDVPDSPLRVVLSIDRTCKRAPALKVLVSAGRQGVQQNPRYYRAACHLLKALRLFIRTSPLYPRHGQMEIDYRANEALTLSIPFPATPPGYFPPTLANVVILPLRDMLRIWLSQARKGEALFSALSRRIPLLIDELRVILHDPATEAKPETAPEFSEEERRRREEAYKLLGVVENAPWEVIKHAYRAQAKKMHPDAKGGVDDGSFQMLQSAFDMLEEWHHRA